MEELLKDTFKENFKDTFKIAAHNLFPRDCFSQH